MNTNTHLCHLLFYLTSDKDKVKMNEGMPGNTAAVMPNCR